MSYTSVFHCLGWTLVLLASLMILPAMTALLDGNTSLAWTFAASAILTGFCGAAFALAAILSRVPPTISRPMRTTTDEATVSWGSTLGVLALVELLGVLDVELLDSVLGPSLGPRSDQAVVLALPGTPGLRQLLDRQQPTAVATGHPFAYQ